VNAPAWLALIVGALITSARIRLGAVIFGQPVSVPLLGLIAVVVVLALAAVVLFLLRSLLREGLRLRATVVIT
jgi:hypothetical protein